MSAPPFEQYAATLERVGPPSRETLDFYNNYANALRCAGRYADADRLLAELVATVPDAWQPWHNLGQTLRDLDRLDEAAAALRQAILLEPGFGPSHGVLGEVLFRLGRLDSAQAALERCVELGCESDPNLWAAIGANQQQLGRLEQAREAFGRALALSDQDPTAHANLGIVLGQLGRFDEAIARLDAAIELEPDNDMLHGYRAYVLLAAGRLGEGWEAWERGFVPGVRGRARTCGVPQWKRADADTRVLVYGEQGLGDELMFASCYPDVINAAREVVIECEPRLRSLFARSFRGAEVRPPTVNASGQETAHDYDSAIAAGSLPRIFRTTLDEFPRRRAFLSADPDRISEWRKRLRAVGPDPYVGVAWRSSVMTAERCQEYTGLRDWDAVLAIPDITWINLQYDDCEVELADAERRFGVRVHRPGSLDLMNDLDEVAALMSALDLVVSARTAVAMLSGALGVETMILANRHVWADLGTGQLLWLPAAQMLYREPMGSWAPVLSAAGQAVIDAVTRGPRRRDAQAP